MNNQLLIARSHQWIENRPNRTEVYTAIQWINGDCCVQIIDQTTGEVRWIDDMRETIIAILDRFAA